MRKKAEHNEGEISTLEELSLHQQDIERYMSTWSILLKPFIKCYWFAFYQLLLKITQNTEK